MGDADVRAGGGDVHPQAGCEILRALVGVTPGLCPLTNFPTPRRGGGAYRTGGLRFSPNGVKLR